MAESNEFFDAHAHMSFAPDVTSFASWFTERFAGAFSTTVSPADYQFAQQALASFPKIKVGVGAHPWWVAQGKISDEDKALLPGLTSVRSGLTSARMGLPRAFLRPTIRPSRRRSKCCA